MFLIDQGIGVHHAQVESLGYGWSWVSGVADTTTPFTAERLYALTGADNRSHRLFGATLTHRLTGADTRNKELKG